jgi:hypothetical protein
MSIARKIAIPAAITTAALGSAPAAAMAATTSHTATTPAKSGTSHRRPRAVDILGHHEPGNVGPRTYSRCRDSAMLDAYVCLYVQGHANYVSFMDAIGCAKIAYNAHVQITSPAFGATVKNGKTKRLGAGTWVCTSRAYWSPYNTVNEGPYTANLWNKNASGGYTLIASTYVSVK